MARMPYYSDPVFLQKLQTMRTPGASFTSPFASTQTAVANRLAGRATSRLNTQFAGAKADAGYRKSLFNNNLAYQKYLQDAQRKQEQRSRRKGLFGSALGVLGGVAGTMLGGPAGGMIGSQIGQTTGRAI